MIPHRAIAIAGAVLASGLAASADPWAIPAGQYFASQKAPVAVYGTVPKRISRQNDLGVILSVTRKLGVPDTLAARVCHVESRCRVNGPPGPMTRHGRHYGAYQTRVNVASRFGYTSAEGPLRGLVALKYGAMHLADCYRRAGGNERRAAACHVGGPGMVPGARGKYANRYVQQVASASPPSWAGRLQVAWVAQ